MKKFYLLSKLVLYSLFFLAGNLARAGEIRFTMTDFEEYCESETLLESARATLEIIRAGRSCAETFAALTTAGPSLNLSNKGIKDLTPLKFFHRVSQLNLSDNLIEDLSPLKDFNRLRELNISNNRIFSLLPLAEIPSLKALKADGNDIESLANFRSDSLEELSLNDNLLILGGVNFSFAKFPSLNSIELRQNGLRVFSFHLGDIADREDLSHTLAVDLRENVLTKEEQDFLQEKLPSVTLSFSPATKHLPSCLVCLPLVADSLESNQDLDLNPSQKKEFISYLQGDEVSEIEKKYIGDLVAQDRLRDPQLRAKIEGHLERIKSIVVEALEWAARSIRFTGRNRTFDDRRTIGGKEIVFKRSEYTFYERSSKSIFHDTLEPDEDARAIDGFESQVKEETDAIKEIEKQMLTLSSEPGSLLSLENLTNLFRREVRKHIVSAAGRKLETSKVVALLYSRSESLKMDHNQLRSLDELKPFHNLRFVDLSHNLIENALALRELPFLERIDLSDNVLGASFLHGGGSDGLGSGSVWDLRLVKNGIDETSFDFTFFGEMKVLKSFDLRENNFHPDDLASMRDEQEHLNWEPTGSVTLADPILLEIAKKEAEQKVRDKAKADAVAAAALAQAQLKVDTTPPKATSPAKRENDKDGDGYLDAIDRCDETPENIVNDPSLKAKINKSGSLVGCFPNGDKITD